MATIQTTQIYDEWFEALRDRQAQARITARIRRLSLGNPGDYRNLKNGVTEMRIDHGPGYRVYYCTRAGITYILLCGGDKKTQSDDVEQAYTLAKDV